MPIISNRRAGGYAALVIWVIVALALIIGLGLYSAGLIGGPSGRAAAPATPAVSVTGVGKEEPRYEDPSAEQSPPVVIPKTPPFPSTRKLPAITAAAEPVIAPGLLLTLEPAAGGAGDVAPTRTLALHVPAGQSAGPFLAPGPFKATWRGFLEYEDLGGQFTFSATASGPFELKINGKTAVKINPPNPAPGSPATLTAIGEPVELSSGRHELIAEFTSPAQGDAWVRVQWQSKDENIDAEPIPPKLLKHDAGGGAARVGAALHRGRELLGSMRCLQCHATAENPAALAGAMPELRTDAPGLVFAGAALRGPWLAAWIADPAALRPTATMPRLLHGPTAPQDARDIAAFLLTQGTPEPDPAFTAEQAAEGAKLYAKLNCFACHTLPDQEIEKTPLPNGGEFPRLPLRHVKAKFRPAALVKFLQKPDQFYLWTSMPDFKLSPQEAAALSAFLLSRPGAELPEPSAAAPGDAARGKLLTGQAGCLNCHGMAVVNSFSAPALSLIKNWSGGCLAAEPSGRAPFYNMTAEDRQAIAHLAGWGIDSLGRADPAQFAARQMRSLRCNACHSMDGKPDLASTFLDQIKELLPAAHSAPAHVEGEGPQVVQTIPDLTHAGQKLRGPWARDFIAGKTPTVRPWLLARMPAFSTRAELLAAGLAHQHGYPLEEPPPGPIDANKAQAGRKLTGMAGGFNCVACHGVGTKRPTAVFEAEGINFQYSAERLRRDYYMRWMMNPPRLDPATKMPRYAVDGRTQITEHFEGDAARQFDAIWQYLGAGRNIVAPQ